MRKMAQVLVMCVLLAGGVAACGGSEAPSGSGTGDSSAPVAAGEKLRFMFLGATPTSIPTAAHYVSGAKAAAELYGATLEYRSLQGQTFDPNEARRLLENTLAKKPDGVVVNDFAPEQLNPSIQALKDAGIPTVLANGGLGQATKVGALTYVGNDESGTGRLGGKMLGALGAKHALLITAQPGIPVVDERNQGFRDGFPGEVTMVALSIADLTDSTKFRNVLEAQVQKDSSIDAVFGIGDCCSVPMLAAREALGDRAEQIHWATIDLGIPVLDAVKSGVLDFALDQQPWLEGYLSVQALALNRRYGFLPGSDFVPTGPVVVDKSNVDQVQKLTSQGIR
jgi:simple sugar transport system substrate-binding protein